MSTFHKQQVVACGSLENFAVWAECYKVYALANKQDFIAIRSEHDEQAMRQSQYCRDAVLVWETGKMIPFDWVSLAGNVDSISRQFYGKTEEEATAAAQAAGIAPERILDLKVTGTMQYQATNGVGATQEKAINNAKAYIKTNAFDVSEAKIVQIGQTGVLEIKAQSEDAARQEWQATRTNEAVLDKFECMAAPHNGLLGIGKKPGSWNAHWSVPFKVQISYRLPAEVTLQYTAAPAGLLENYGDLEQALKSGKLKPELLPTHAFVPERTTLLSWNDMVFQFTGKQWVKLLAYPSATELHGFSITKERWSSGNWGVLYRLYVREQVLDENDSKGDFNVKKLIHSSAEPRAQVNVVYKSTDGTSWYPAVYRLFSILKDADLIYASTLRIEEKPDELILCLETPVSEQVEKQINQTGTTDSGQSLSARLGSSDNKSEEVLVIYPDKIVCHIPAVKAGFLRALGGFPSTGNLDLGKFDLKAAS